MKRFTCVIIIIFLLVGCSPNPALSWQEEFDAGGEPTATIAYIPLDNRPVNTYRVELLAKAAGFKILMPEEELFRTALDGQPLNKNGTQHGDGASLLAWLENTVADYYVISVDQIMSGGLVNSRHMSEITDEMQKTDRLLAALEGKKAVLFDTVMRLAPTVGYAGYTLAEYKALRAYGKLPRPLLSGELTADEVIANYSVPTDLAGDVAAQYLAARTRKIKISEHLLSKISKSDNIHLYYGIDDASTGNTIQTNEIAFIEQNLANGQIFAGTDEMGLLAVTRAVRNHYNGGHIQSVTVRYFGIDPDAPADIYDIGSLKSNISTHLTALGIEMCERGGNMELLVLGNDTSSALLSQYTQNLQNKIPTMIVDLSGDYTLPREMIFDNKMDYTYLLGYSSWNTAGNAIGIALSSGISRYLYLENEHAPVKGANSAFVRGLALSFAKDVSYNNAKPKIDEYIGKIGGNTDNFYGVEVDCNAVLEMVQDGTPLSFGKIANAMAGKHFLMSPSTQTVGIFPEMYISRLSFPWHRTFEAALFIEIADNS